MKTIKRILRGALALGVALAINAGTVTSLQDSPPPNDQILFSGNIMTPYKARTLALMAKDIQGYESLDSLVTCVEKITDVKEQTKELKDKCASTVIYYGKKFSEHVATKAEHDSARAVLRVKIEEFNNERMQKSGFYITINRYGDFEVCTSKDYSYISKRQWTMLQKYLPQVKRLFENQSSEEMIQRKLSSTLTNLSPDIEEIVYVSKTENAPIEKMVATSTIESLGNSYAVGRGGEVGRYQIMLNTAQKVYKKNPELFDFPYEEIIENMARDPGINARFAALVLLENNLPDHEQAVSYNQGITRVNSMNPDTLRNHWYGKYFVELLDGLKAKAYLKEPVITKKPEENPSFSYDASKNCFFTATRDISQVNVK